MTGEERTVGHRPDWPGTRARLLGAKGPCSGQNDRCTRREESPRESVVPALGGQAVFGYTEWLESIAGSTKSWS